MYQLEYLDLEENNTYEEILWHRLMINAGGFFYEKNVGVSGSAGGTGVS